MNIHQLLKENDFEQIWSKYSKSEEQKTFYADMYYVLVNKLPKSNTDNMKVYVEFVKDAFTEEIPQYYYDVSGKKEDGSYSISMTDWDEIVGYDVELNDIPIEVFIIELIDEITFYGTEEEMRKVRYELNETIEGIEAGRIKPMTLDDLIAELDYEEDDDKDDVNLIQ